MSRFRPQRPSASMVVALIALFVALGGSSYAAITITGKNVKNGSLTGSDIKSGSLSGKQIKSGSLTGKQIKSGSLSGKQIANGSLSGAQVANDSLGGGQINEATLGKVPAAGNADTVGGKPASAFGPAARWITVQGTAGGGVTLGQSGGFGTVTRLTTGEYSIDAGQSVANRALSVTMNAASGGGFISVVPCGGSANNPGGIDCPGVNDVNHVIVVTLSTAAASADRTFQFIIG
jgi:hypothetical protein